jgi:hypothetical protein
MNGINDTMFRGMVILKNNLNGDPESVEIDYLETAKDNNISKIAFPPSLLVLNNEGYLYR